MMLRFVAILAVLACWPSFAQTGPPHPVKPRPAKKTPEKPAAPSRWPIETLAVEGNRNFSKEQILSVAGLKLGQLAGKEEFEAARDRLVATGAFETVGYRFAPAGSSGGYAASFQVVEAGPLYPVRFEGLEVPAAEISAWLKSKDPLYGPKIPATSPILDRYARNIEEFLVSRGQKLKVVGKLAPLGPGEFGVMFRSAAPLATIAEVKFEGNKYLSTTKLQNQISEVAYGFPYSEAGFRTLLDNSIRPLYDAQGLVHVAFPKVAVEKANGVNGLLVNVTVTEGEPFKLGDVQFAGGAAGKSSSLLKLGAFKIGDIANFDDIGQGVERIKKSLRRSGFMRADANVERVIHDKSKTVDLIIHVNQGPQFVFGALTIEGLDLNAEAAIKKLWGLQPGKPFNGDYPDYFLNRVREDGVFENLHKTKSVVKVDEENRVVNVTLEFH